jgi:hypothetical protein
MKRVLAVGAVAVLIAGGAMGIFFYASATPIFYASSPAGAPSTRIVTSQTSTKGAGWIDPNGQPQGAWAAYLGFIPAGYSLAPHDTMAPTFPCPAGMSSDQCGLFRASCGNGVCDPNEGCTTCPIDCSVTGQLTCDPYTGRATAHAGICFRPVGG